MTDKPFQSGSLFLVDLTIDNIAHFNKKIPKKKLILFLCPPQVKNYVTTATNSQPFKIFVSKM